MKNMTFPTLKGQCEKHKMWKQYGMRDLTNLAIVFLHKVTDSRFIFFHVCHDSAVEVTMYRYLVCVRKHCIDQCFFSDSFHSYHHHVHTKQSSHPHSNQKHPTVCLKMVLNPPRERIRLRGAHQHTHHLCKGLHPACCLARPALPKLHPFHPAFL
jgi:hypothetical protein